jgi:acetylornithine deacetylase/succinyl-diaminopimelate desuccinylase-like protein
VKLLVKLIKSKTKKGGKLIGGHGSSDARHFTRVSCPAVEFGPIYGGIGSDNEWVDIPSLEKYFQILKNFLFSLH